MTMDFSETTHSNAADFNDEPHKWPRIEFGIYAASTLFFVFISVSAIHDFPGRWGQISLILAGLTPVTFLFLKHRLSFFHFVLSSGERVFLYALLFFSVLNIYTSATRWASLKGILVFFITGIAAYMTARFILRSLENRRRFLILVTISFFSFVLVGLLEYLSIGDGSRRVHALQSNPIPAGSLLILLIAGPWTLFNSLERPLSQWLLGSVTGLSAALLLATGERGPILGGLALLVLAALWKWRWKGFKLGMGGLIILALFLWQGKELLPQHYQDKLSNLDGIYLRLDAYPLAWELFKQHPVLGIGYNAEMEHAVPVDFKASFFISPHSEGFVQYFERGNTFDNIILCFFVEGGSLFALAYVAFIALVITRALSTRGKPSQWPDDLIILLIVLTVFGLHSMTFDSLKFPALNWMFHSFLGYMAASSQSNFLSNSQETG